MGSGVSAWAQELAHILSDYAPKRVTTKSVIEWINQFDVEDREMVLVELAHVLKRTYISRTRAKRAMEDFLLQIISRYYSGDPLRFRHDVRFLETQEGEGESQYDMIALANEVLRTRWGFTAEECGRSMPKRFIYLDDVVYSGNRLRYDFLDEKPEGRAAGRGWLLYGAPRGSTIHVFVLAAHSVGWEYAQRHIRAEAVKRGVKVFFHTEQTYANRRVPCVEHCCLWPRSDYGDAKLQRYLEYLRREAKRRSLDCLFLRPESTPLRETFFSSPEGREVLERTFVLKGLELIENTRVQSLRPLGWEKLLSLGFGTLVFSYRNCPNTVPVVLWWRGGGWRPLVERRQQEGDDWYASF